MKITRVLNEIANSTSALYRIVFTAMLMYELARHGLKRRKRAENYRDNSHTARH